MNVAYVAGEVCERFLCEGDTSNKPFELTGHHQFSAVSPQSPCLPLKGSVRRIGSQGKNLWHKISELEIDRSGIFSVPMTAVHSRKDLTLKNSL
jgi:hypothetical protein